VTSSVTRPADVPLSTAYPVDRRVLRPTRSEALAAIASAALFAIAFPPFRFIVPAFVALVPFAVDVMLRGFGRRWDDNGLAPVRVVGSSGEWTLGTGAPVATS